MKNIQIESNGAGCKIVIDGVDMSALFSELNISIKSGTLSEIRGTLVGTLKFDGEHDTVVINNTQPFDLDYKLRDKF